MLRQCTQPPQCHMSHVMSHDMFCVTHDTWVMCRTKHTRLVQLVGGGSVINKTTPSSLIMTSSCSIARGPHARYLCLNVEGVDRDGQPHQAQAHTQQLAAAGTRAHPGSKGGRLWNNPAMIRISIRIEGSLLPVIMTQISFVEQLILCCDFWLA